MRVDQFHLIDERAEDLYEQAPCGYLSLAGDGTILKVNETLLTWLDYERSEIVGALRFPELLSMGGRIYYETHFAPLLNMQGFVNEVAFDLQTKQGRQIPVMTSTIQRRDPRNTATVNRMTVFNMTERRRYERELLIERRKAERIAEDHAALAKELQTDIAARQRAEVLLREQAHLNAFAAQIALHLIERGALADMLDGCVRTIIGELKATHACIWSLRADDQTLEVLAGAGSYRDLRPIHSRIPVDHLAMGRLVATRRPYWTNQVAGDPLLPEQEWPKRDGIRAFAAYPLVIEDRVIGLLALFLSHDPSDTVLRTMSSVARQIALGIERIRTGDALQESEARYRTLAGQLEQIVEKRTADLVASQHSLRTLAAELNLAEQRERKRLAAELHDHLQQLLVLGKLKLGQGKRRTTSSESLAVMQQVDALLSEALAYTRTLVAELNPPVLREHGLGAALQWLGEYMRKHDLQVAVTVPEQDDTRLPEEQMVLVFQSVRELLINSSKHAGTGEATVAMEQRDNVLRIEVNDRGKGFSLAAAQTPNELSSQFGLYSIQERMRTLGGSLDIQSSSQGTTCVLILPRMVPA